MILFYIIYKMMAFDFRFSPPFASYMYFCARMTHNKALDVALDDFGWRLLYIAESGVGQMKDPPAAALDM